MMIMQIGKKVALKGIVHSLMNPIFYMADITPIGTHGGESLCIFVMKVQKQNKKDLDRINNMSNAKVSKK